MFFDFYHQTTEFPPNVFQALAEGKAVDPALIRNPLFYEDLVALRGGKPIVDPCNRELQPAKYIILEEPFGRAREGMKELIDYIACIQLPLDIALARRVLRNLRKDFNHLPVDERMAFVEASLEEYLNGGRIAYQKIFEFVSADCDLLLDGQGSAEEMAEAVMLDLRKAGVLD